MRTVCPCFAVMALGVNVKFAPWTVTARIFCADVAVDEVDEAVGVTAGGVVRYGAPKGYHDDKVIALALCWHGLYQEFVRRPAPVERMVAYMPSATPKTLKERLVAKR